MLLLKQSGKTIGFVQEGGWVNLPNGSVLSPAINGWASGSYSLETAPTEDETILDRHSPTTEEQKRNRSLSYRDEADPIFFKWQRSEATEQEWLDKIEEIKLRYPYPQV